ncbi:MAG: ycfH [Planctomycetaceae bacterium]|nr:ycfH [Planctomycetaceae bacterium]
MEWVDTHAHVQEEAFDPDRSEVLKRAREAGVSTTIVVGFTVDSSRRAVELAVQYPELRAVVGIQPNYVQEARPADWETILELSRAPHVVGIGETGLDLYWDTCPIALQIEYFQRHIQLSRDTGMPFVVHCRNAEQEVVQVLQSAAHEGPLNGVMHSFTGTLETAQACLDIGMCLSFAGMATFKNNHALRAVAVATPSDRILVETDCPYLAPTPHRGKRNEPAFVRNTADCLAIARGVSSEEFAALTTENARRVFRLK